MHGMVRVMSVEFGVFDHLDRNDLPLRDYYEQRLKVIEAFDRCGFYAYHVAEHHFTPLGMAPSPSVFLSAIAQRTRRLRFGTFVYALPVHHPLRVLEEICMLDHMSGGRLEIGFGRGSVPYRDCLLRAERRGAPADLCRASRVDPQGVHGEKADLEGALRPVRECTHGAHAPAEAAPAAVVRRAFAGQRRTRGPPGPEHCHQRYARQGARDHRPLSRDLARHPRTLQRRPKWAWCDSSSLRTRIPRR